VVLLQWRGAGLRYWAPGSVPGKVEILRSLLPLRRSKIVFEVGIGLETVLVLATLLLSRGLWLMDDFMLSIDGELMSAKGIVL
jgi:hypothetical protein